MMKNKILIAGFCGALAFSCNKKAETEAKETIAPDVEAPAVVAVEKECYEFVKNKDTVTLSLTRNENDASGSLTFNWFEKDDSNGIFKGMFKGDTLVADYTFQAEGTSSVREMVFLKKGDVFYPGYGEMVEKENKQVFKDPKSIKFDDAVKIARTACR
ncbi:hypothetical protein FNO01nite_19170 [Flavobacterium noncentrifugens]|uniref:Lipoprotein n=2 Tax=Flavobacterium noncentrifugens TaxID=1128970 RepID=A0A1G8YKW0_9FLAO|nr:hypothetical protein FNO01nite_19170 [Flavobacterium noncentrifugens]SDK02795.1 hypothetical protein SAMN04487935_2354 [Flavobacterium noncentrifugens]